MSAILTALSEYPFQTVVIAVLIYVVLRGQIVFRYPAPPNKGGGHDSTAH